MNEIGCSVIVLTPVYNEEEALPEYYNEVRATLLEQNDYQFEVLFIDDGSRDKSWSVIQDICQRDSRCSGIRLSRNFGAHLALTAGFANADADAVAILACDLQDPPETILEFVEQWQNGAHIVWGHRKNRDDEFWRVWISKLFNLLVRSLAMPAQSKFTTGSFLLVDRKVVECLNKFRETNRITFALVAWTGFEQAIVWYDRRKRISGKSGWSLSRQVKTMYDAFLGFSFVPVRTITHLGIGVSAVAIVSGSYVFFSWLGGDPVPGYTSIMLALMFFFGIQFVLLGFFGEYLHRIYSETIKRPLYFIWDSTKNRDCNE